MKVPFSWLSEYVELDGLTPQEVADQLTMGAFEVEEIRRFGGGVEGPVVVGEIVTINPLPKTSKVRLTTVKVDPTSSPLEIVCGAQNIEVGQVVPVALPGATVINRKDGSPLAIKAAPIYGVLSNGMLCSPPELGLTGGESEGILIFDKTLNYKLGQDVRAILSLSEDFVLHVSPRSNRGDALSIRGLAREVAALTRRPLNEPEWSLPNPDSQVKTFKTEIESIDDCELFTIRTLAKLAVGESPAIIKRRLEAVGIRSINNIVDITNYVMHELGQSLHAYDAAKISGESFLVRRARSGEKIKTIDGKERNLDGEILAIADNKQIVGLAGIMGGLDSEVSSATREIALEAASFQPARVRRGTRLLGLHSEASLRFERGVDVNSAVKASDRASYLIAKYCSANGPVAIGGLSKAGSEMRDLPRVSMRLSQVKRILDIDLSATEVIEMLKPLGFAHEHTESVHRPEEKLLRTIFAEGQKPSGSESLTFTVPSYRRRDVGREIDLIEEVCRIYGYERLPQSMPKATAAASYPENTAQRVRAAFAGQGLNEAVISSLVRPEANLPDTEMNSNQFQFGTQDPATIVRVLNPQSKDHQVLRQSLLPGLVEAAKSNLDHGEQDIWLFEIGRSYFKRLHGDTAQTKGTSEVEEPLKVAGLLTGQPSLSKWTEQVANNPNSPNGGIDSEAVSRSGVQKPAIDFYQAKGVIENLLDNLRIDRENLRFCTETAAPLMMHPAKSARIDFVGQTKAASSGQQKELLSRASASNIGWLGEIHPSLADKLGLDPATYIFELDMETLGRLSRPPLFRPIMTAPAVSRDLTVDLPKNIDNAAVVSCIKAAAGSNFKAVELISKYPLSNELKSFSYRLTFQHPEQTLRSEEVDGYLTKIRSSLTGELGASFRV
jgi:phenylalanyl-tRNA synthetase beta chain